MVCCLGRSRMLLGSDACWSRSVQFIFFSPFHTQRCVFAQFLSSMIPIIPLPLFTILVFFVPLLVFLCFLRFIGVLSAFHWRFNSCKNKALAHEIFDEIEYIDATSGEEEGNRSRSSSRHNSGGTASSSGSTKTKAKSRYVVKRPAPPPPLDACLASKPLEARLEAPKSSVDSSRSSFENDRRFKSKAPPPPTMPKPHKTIEGYWKPRERIAESNMSTTSTGPSIDRMTTSMFEASSSNKPSKVSQNIRKAFSLKERVKPPSLYPRPLIRPDPKPAAHSFFPSPKSKRSSKESELRSSTSGGKNNIKTTSKAKTCSMPVSSTQRSSTSSSYGCDQQSDKYSRLSKEMITGPVPRLSKEMITGPVHLLDQASQEKYLGEVGSDTFSPQLPSSHFHCRDNSSSSGAISFRLPFSTVADVASSPTSCKNFIHFSDDSLLVSVCRIIFHVFIQFCQVKPAIFRRSI